MELLQRYGAVLQNGVVQHFGDEVGEYQAARQAAVVADVSQRARVEITGKDRVRWLNNYITNDLSSIPTDQGCEGFLLDAKGHTLFHVWAWMGTESLWLDAGMADVAALLKHLDRYILREDVQPRDASASDSQFFVTGPWAAAVLQPLIRPRAEPELADWPPLRQASVLVGDCPSILRRVDRGPFPGFDLMLKQTNREAVWETLTKANLRPAGARVIETLRLEVGLPEVGREITPNNLAQEFDRVSQTIHFRKGCYLGQETVARLDAMGHVNKILRGVVADGPPLPLGAKILHGDKEVGILTSSGFSPALGRAIGLAVVRTMAQTPGTIVEIDNNGEKHQAIISSLPFLPQTTH